MGQGMRPDRDESFMRHALRLAVRARGRTWPNPLVGAVVVRDGEIVGQGWHRRAGTPHAEVHALAAAGEAARGATIYVTLEPCNHHGRTPPCTGAILAAGIRRVVVGMGDPNPRVAGGGAGFLRAQGLEVVTGILEDECRAINRPFCKWITSGRPWTVMKAGVSLDGRIAPAGGEPLWITNEASRRHVHRLRDETAAILVGVGTVLSDDPALTTRLPGRRGRDPLRVVLDSRLRLPETARMLGQGGPGTLVFCGPDHDPKRRLALETAGAEVCPVEADAHGRPLVDAVVAELGRRQILHLLVEGGAEVHAAFLEAGAYDEAILYYGPLFLGGDGVPLVGPLARTDGKVPVLTALRRRRFGDDLMVRGRFQKSEVRRQKTDNR